MSTNQPESSDLLGSEMEELPENWLAAMATFAMGHRNGTRDYTAPILKPLVSNIYPVFVVQYALLILVGVTLNVLIAFKIVRESIFKDVTHALILNLVLSHCVQCLVVMPVTLMVLLIQNWIFGQFFCYFLPMLQDIPLHVCMITHLLIAWDRLRWLRDHPLRSRLPAFVCSCATWLAGIVITLPYPIYIIYMDLGMYMKEFQGVGFCTVNLVDDMHEYMRGIFITMYCAPTVLLSYLYIRSSSELKPPHGALGVMMFEARADACQRAHFRPRDNPSRPSYDLYDAELDVNREKRTQHHLAWMAGVQVLCISPLMVLRLARFVLEETYANTDHFDLTFLMFVWIAFLPTAINPIIYAAWVLSSPAKERLRGYFRLSSAKRRAFLSAGDVETTTAKENNKERHARGGYCKRASDSSALTTQSSIAGSMGPVQTKPTKSQFLRPQLKIDSEPSADGSANIPLNEKFLPGAEAGMMERDSSYSNSAADTISNLEQDLEIIDLLERERSMDIRESLAVECEAQRTAIAKGRRKLPTVRGSQSTTVTIQHVVDDWPL